MAPLGSKWLNVVQCGAIGRQVVPLGATYFVAKCDSMLRIVVHIQCGAKWPHLATWCQVVKCGGMWRNVVIKLKKILNHISPHFTTFNHKMIFFKMWPNVFESGAMHHIALLVPLGAKWSNLAHIYEPQFATLSNIKTQSMWRQVAPHWTTFRHFEPSGAILTSECVPQYNELV